MSAHIMVDFMKAIDKHWDRDPQATEIAAMTCFVMALERRYGVESDKVAEQFYFWADQLATGAWGGKKS